MLTIQRTPERVKIVLAKIYLTYFFGPPLYHWSLCGVTYRDITMRKQVSLTSSSYKKSTMTAMGILA